MWRSVSALVLVCSLGSAGPVFAQVQDQAFIPSPFGGVGLWCISPPGQTVFQAQTFTAGITGVLTRVQLLLWASAFPAQGSGRLQVAIFSTTNGAPASAIQTFIFPTGPYPTQDAGGAFGDFPGFSVPVTAGESYAIVVTALDPVPSFSPMWANSGQGKPTYAGGRPFTIGCGGNTAWTPLDVSYAFDFGFRTFVTGGNLLPPTNVQAVQAGASTLSVTWSPPSTGAAPEGYSLDFFASGTLVARVLVGPGGSVSLPIPPGTSGNFLVTVSSRIGASVSVPSSPAAFSIGSSPCVAPPAPTGLNGSVTSATARVQWTAVPGATSYIVSAGSSPGAFDLFNGDVGNVTGVTASGLPAGFRAFVRVLAVAPCGRSVASAEFELR